MKLSQKQIDLMRGYSNIGLIFGIVLIPFANNVGSIVFLVSLTVRLWVAWHNFRNGGNGSSGSSDNYAAKWYYMNQQNN